MRLLLDECVTRLIKRDFLGHEVQTVKEVGLKGLKNGQLLRAAVGQFDVLITVDQNLSYQQNVKPLSLAVLVLIAKKNTYEALSPLVPQALVLLENIKPGQVLSVKASS